jgi:hypothetical protein
MPTLGQLEAQLRGDNAATTVGGIACDSNLHSEKGRPFLESVPKSLSFDGKDKLWMQILYEIGLWSERNREKQDEGRTWPQKRLTAKVAKNGRYGHEEKQTTSVLGEFTVWLSCRSFGQGW